MTPRADVALCPVKANGCTHHAHCLRAQLPPHPTRQAWCSPNRRGDECGLFTPIEASPEFAGPKSGNAASVSGDQGAADTARQEAAPAGDTSRGEKGPPRVWG